LSLLCWCASTVEEGDIVLIVNTSINMDNQLCEKCSVLSFDDSIFSHLVQSSPEIVTSLNDVIPDCEDEKGRQILLEYDRTDLFPYLPGLTASAETGCLFCKALRDATLNSGISGSCRIAYRLRYLWRSPCPPATGLSVLLADWRVIDEDESSEDSDDWETWAFEIESEGKTSPYLLLSCIQSS
jgi:hypothetical protein